MMGGIAILAMLVAAQAALAFLSPGLTQAALRMPSDALPLLALLVVPGAAGLAYGLRHFEKMEANTWRLAIVFAAGLAMRLVWLGAPGPLEDDFNRYLWDGAVVAAGESPYRVSPESAPGAGPPFERLAREGEHVLRGINFPDLASIYPGAAQAVFAIAHWVAPWRLDGLRLVFVAADISTFFLLIALLDRYGQARLRAGFYWLNPLVVFSTTATAHVDALLPPLVIGLLLAATNGRWVLAGVFGGLATGVKIWPALLAPLLIRRVAGRVPHLRLAGAGAVALTIAVLALWPLLAASGQEASGLRAYAEGWVNNNAPLAWCIWVLDQLYGEASDGPERLLRMALGLAAVAAAITAAYRSVRSGGDLALRAMWVTAAVFYLSPAQFPWYAVTLLALAALAASGPLLLASVTLPVYYLSFVTDYDTYQNGLAILHAAPVWFWLAWQSIEKRGAGRTAPA